MKFLGTVALAASLMQTASAHYIWQSVNGGAANAYFRVNTNYNSPITDTTDTNLRCNVGASASGGSTGTLTVAAGTQVTLGLDTAVYHQGPVMFYLGKVPSGSTAATWNGSGASWFKFLQLGPTFSGGASTWPMSATYSVTIPAALPAGQWLLRAEQIGLHNPGGLPQFYVGCAQLQVTGGGSCSPSLFSIPGHITASDPGITVNIYSNFNSYTFPGPAVGTCSGSGGGGSSPQPTTTLRTSTTTRVGTTAAPTSRTTTTSARPVTTSASSGTGAPLYGQCGGSGWTGPTTCAQGTCSVLNSYYSQCT